jgi:threonylcarbamoyladenosine tRNA methylthiotransferase MtaB
VLREVERHLAASCREVVLTGVDLTSWGHDLPESPTLGVLVTAIFAAFPDLPRLRLSSLDGIEIDPALFELLAHEPRVMPHVHLSLQHGDDLILKRMKRRHSRADALALAEHLRRHRPGLALGADLIAGFPTEDDEAHAASLSLVEQMDLVHLHVFPYSPRAQTPAARMPQLPAATIRARAAALRAAGEARRLAWMQSLVGQPLSVLAERDETGHAENFARVRLGPGIKPGTVVTMIPTRIEEGLLA